MKRLMFFVTGCIMLYGFCVYDSDASTCTGVGIFYVDKQTNKPAGSHNTNIPLPPDQGYVDPIVNHKHAIGMHSVRYRMPGQDNWHYGEVAVQKGTHDKIDIRVKVKEKESRKWKDVCIDLY